MGFCPCSLLGELLLEDVWMSITAASESGDVNCLVTLSENVFAAGSMDGSLRFFHAEQGLPHVVLWTG